MLRVKAFTVKKWEQNTLLKSEKNHPDKQGLRMGNAAKKIRVDYSALVVHLQEREARKANKLLAELLPKLVNYLQVTMGADNSIAEECVQQAFLNVYERLIDDKIRDPKSLLSYLMQACRNEYLTYSSYQKRFVDGDTVLDKKIVADSPDQVERLVEEERIGALETCIENLDDESREFIKYYLENPGVSSKQVGRHFGISAPNARIRKLRITRKLHDMYQELTRN